MLNGVFQRPYLNKDGRNLVKKKQDEEKNASSSAVQREEQPNQNSRSKGLQYVEQKRPWKCKLNKGKSRPSWLRDIGQDKSRAAFIGKDGSIHLGGSLVNSQRNSVRPMMWVRWH